MPVVTLVSQTVVEADDPAFANPTKFVGSVYDEIEAKTPRPSTTGPSARDGDGWRRVVASPAPVRVVETPIAELLLRNGVMVVLAGGGGVPVIEGSLGLEGIEAVVDKDLVSALVAEELEADLFVVLTDVPAVMVDFGTPQQRPLTDVTPAELGQAHLPNGLDGTEDRSGLPVRHHHRQPGRRRIPRRGRRSRSRYGRTQSNRALCSQPQ